MPAHVSFVVLTHERPEELTRCLRSIRRQSYANKELVVVDNASSDHTPEILEHRFPEATTIRLDKNLGVAGGRNRGAAAAMGEVLVFLDDDAEFPDADAASVIMDYFTTHPALGCLALRVIDPATDTELRNAIPRLDKRPMDDDYPCAYFCGAGFAIRASVFRELGGFWDVLFYSAEEVDLSYRLLHHGYGILHTASVCVLHAESPNQRPSERAIYFNARNRSWVALRNLPWLYVATTTLGWWTYCIWQGAKTGHMHPAWRGIQDAICGAPGAFQLRRPISVATLQTIRSLRGRTWF